MSLAAEVCIAHRDADCTVCEPTNDDLWIHPDDLPLPHEECWMCDAMVATRQERIAQLTQAIDLLESEIVEIERGMSHTAYHELYCGRGA